MPEDEIITQNDIGTHIFFIAKGEIQVYVEDQSKNESKVNELETGASFGEIALLKGCRRTATCRSKNYSTCAAIDRDNMNELKGRFPEIQVRFEN